MRPSLLDPLFAPATSLTGVGAKIAALLTKVLPSVPDDREPRVGDLLFVLPHSIIDRRSRPGIANALEGTIVTLDLHVDRHFPAPPGRKNVPHRVLAHDETGEITLVFFHAKRAWLENAMPVGEDIVVRG